MNRLKIFFKSKWLEIAIMSIGSYIAADENKIDTQYIYSEYRDNKPIEGSQKALIVSRYENR